MTRREYLKNKKLRHQRLGVNSEWVIRYIITPLAMLILTIFIILGASVSYTEYATAKAIAEEEAERIKESARAEEMAKQEEIRLQNLRQLEEEKWQNEIKQAELERQRTNTLYENQVSKRKCSIGTYLRNDKTKKVGRVVGYYGLEVITNNEWNYTLDSNGNKPGEITEIGYVEYIRTLKRQKEQEEKKLKKENAKKIQKILDEELKIQTEKTKSYMGNYKHIEYNNKKYRVVDINGEELILLEQKMRNKKTNYIYLNAYANGVKKISWREFEIIKK